MTQKEAIRGRVFMFIMSSTMYGLAIYEYVSGPTRRHIGLVGALERVLGGYIGTYMVAAIYAGLGTIGFLIFIESLRHEK